MGKIRKLAEDVLSSDVKDALMSPVVGLNMSANT